VLLALFGVSCGLSFPSGKAIQRRRKRAPLILREVRAALVDFASAEGGAYPQQFEAVAARSPGAQLSVKLGSNTPSTLAADRIIHFCYFQVGNYGWVCGALDLRACEKGRAASLDPPY
jgi:hypothetical protein